MEFYHEKNWITCLTLLDYNKKKTKLFNHMLINTRFHYIRDTTQNHHHTIKTKELAK